MFPPHSTSLQNCRALHCSQSCSTLDGNMALLHTPTPAAPETLLRHQQSSSRPISSSPCSSISHVLRFAGTGQEHGCSTAQPGRKPWHCPTHCLAAAKPGIVPQALSLQKQKDYSPCSATGPWRKAGTCYYSFWKAASCTERLLGPTAKPMTAKLPCSLCRQLVMQHQLPHHSMLQKAPVLRTNIPKYRVNKSCNKRSHHQLKVRTMRLHQVFKLLRANPACLSFLLISLH